MCNFFNSKRPQPANGANTQGGPGAEKFKKAQEEWDDILRKCHKTKDKEARKAKIKSEARAFFKKYEGAFWVACIIGLIAIRIKYLK
jgi:hypothetical protein